MEYFLCSRILWSIRSSHNQKIPGPDIISWVIHISTWFLSLFLTLKFWIMTLPEIKWSNLFWQLDLSSFYQYNSGHNFSFLYKGLNKNAHRNQFFPFFYNNTLKLKKNGNAHISWTNDQIWNIFCAVESYDLYEAPTIKKFQVRILFHELFTFQHDFWACF